MKKTEPFKALLEVGDWVVNYRGNEIRAKIQITRVTATQAISERERSDRAFLINRFRREVINPQSLPPKPEEERWHVDEVKRDVWAHDAWYVLTPQIDREVKEQIARQKMAAPIRRFFDKCQPCELWSFARLLRFIRLLDIQPDGTAKALPPR